MALERAIVELIDESGDLVGYGVCVITPEEGDTRATYTMLPDVHGVRSQAHAAAREHEGQADWQADAWRRIRERDATAEYDATGKRAVTGETDAEHFDPRT